MGDGRNDKEWARKYNTRKAMEGKSAYAISKEIGVAENTAKRYISGPVTQHGLKGRVKGSKLDPYKPQIDAIASAGDL
ncbi:MAG: hypothetical protein ACFWTN_12035 [Clostridium sp.]|jgi:transposase